MSDFTLFLPYKLNINSSTKENEYKKNVLEMNRSKSPKKIRICS